MKKYVTNPQSDFIKAIIEPGSVVFNGRSPLPAAIYSDTEWINKFNLYNNKIDSIAKPLSYRKINEFEKFLSDKAKQTLKLIRPLPDKTGSDRAKKNEAIEKEIIHWQTEPDKLEAEIIIEILNQMMDTQKNKIQ